EGGRGRARRPPGGGGARVGGGGADRARGAGAAGRAGGGEPGLRPRGPRHEQRIPMVVAGAGVRAGAAIRSGSTVDLMPTLCRLVGVDAGAVQGRVLDEILL